MIEELISQWDAYRGLTSPPPVPVRLWSEGGCGVWIDNARGSAVPYGSVDHGDGRQNYGYVRINDATESVGRIPETTGFPEFAAFLMIVNSPDSAIESVGCEKSFFPGDVEGGPRVKLGSYIDVMFTDAMLNDCAENTSAEEASAIRGDRRTEAAVFPLQVPEAPQARRRLFRFDCNGE